MSNTMDQLLQQATASTFESLAFCVPDVELTEEQEAAPLDCAVGVEFHGPVRGRLMLHVTGTLLPMLAANMLGEEQSQFVPLQRDALGELANVVCGNLLPVLAGADAVFRLEAPNWCEPANRARGGDAPMASVTLGVEEGRAQVQLFAFAGAEHFRSGAPSPAAVA